MPERIVAEALSRFGSIRVVISLTDATIEVEHWHRGPVKCRRQTLESSELDRLRAQAEAVPQEEQLLVQGDFYADGEERLRVELEGHTVEIRNETDRIRTPRARALLARCYELAERVMPNEERFPSD